MGDGFSDGLPSEELEAVVEGWVWAATGAEEEGVEEGAVAVCFGTPSDECIGAAFSVREGDDKTEWDEEAVSAVELLDEIAESDGVETVEADSVHEEEDDDEEVGGDADEDEVEWEGPAVWLLWLGFFQAEKSDEDFGVVVDCWFTGAVDAEEDAMCLFVVLSAGMTRIDCVVVAACWVDDAVAGRVVPGG